jgi:glycosyltransferase involved in cell wall biosynthesis
VIDDFKAQLPQATVYVYDNNSRDQTGEIALEHGAIVRPENRQGKGNVVRQMFRDIDADYYVLVDGDDTYPAEMVKTLLEPVQNGLADIVIGDRLSNDSYYRENRRSFHNFGNSLVCLLIKWLYGVDIRDAMSGYRVFNHVFVKTVPLLAKGFEIEVEMDIHAIDNNWRIHEIPIEYRDRPEGSFSKLSTFRDGWRVLLTILSLFKDFKPLVLFSFVALLFIMVGLVLGISVVFDFIQTGLVDRFPTAILAVALIIVGMLSLTCGVILDTIVKANHKEYEVSIHQTLAQIKHRKNKDTLCDE